MISGAAGFNTILVYDVSRWGRFQDSDESAHYEFICRQAGVSIEYCAEQFSNDGSLTATIVKNIKRAMAGEYSRELSVKTHAGQSRLARLGYYFGTNPGYGLRRMLVDEHGNRKMQMEVGQRKSLHTEHTILVPGPPEEIKLIYEVYELFLDKGEFCQPSLIISTREYPQFHVAPLVVSCGASTPVERKVRWHERIQSSIQKAKGELASKSIS